MRQTAARPPRPALRRGRAHPPACGRAGTPRARPPRRLSPRFLRAAACPRVRAFASSHGGRPDTGDGGKRAAGDDGGRSERTGVRPHVAGRLGDGLLAAVPAGGTAPHHAEVRQQLCASVPLACGEVNVDQLGSPPGRKTGRRGGSGGRWRSGAGQLGGKDARSRLRSAIREMERQAEEIWRGTTLRSGFYVKSTALVPAPDSPVGTILAERRAALVADLGEQEACSSLMAASARVAGRSRPRRARRPAPVGFLPATGPPDRGGAEAHCVIGGTVASLTAVSG